MSIASTGLSDWEKPVRRAAYSVAETADLLSLSEATVYRLLRRGTLASVLIGGSRRIPAPGIERLLETQPVAARAA